MDCGERERRDIDGRCHCRVSSGVSGLNPGLIGKEYSSAGYLGIEVSTFVGKMRLGTYDFDLVKS